MKDAAELDALWANRHLDGQLADFEREMERSLTGSGAAPWALWRLARAKHFRAMQRREAKDPIGARELLLHGQAPAKQALLSDPNDMGALFWLACCELEWGQARSKLAAAKTLSVARRRLDRAAELDAGFHYAGPLRVLGRVSHMAPRWLGGGFEKAVALYERALQLAPGHPTTKLYMAEALFDTGRRPEARKVLAEVVADPPFPDWIWEQERDRRRARLLLEAFPT